MKNIWKVFLRALKLERQFYSNISGDGEDITLAAIIVLVSSLAAGIGSLSQVGIAGILFGTIGALINWGVWAAIVYFVLTGFFDKDIRADSPREIFIALGFGAAPGVIKAGGIIPPFHSFLFILSYLWMGATMVRALEVKTELKNRWLGPAIVIGGWLGMVLVIGLIGLSMKRIY